MFIWKDHWTRSRLVSWSMVENAATGKIIQFEFAVPLTIIPAAQYSK